MRKKEDDGIKTYSPSLNSVLEENARSITADLINPHPQQMSETNGAAHRVMMTRPGYKEQAQGTQASGRPVSNNTRAPLAGGRFIQPVQGPGPRWLEPDPRGEA